MQIYQCPNCGRTYTEFENVYYCGNCNYRLVKQENIKEIKNPKLSERNYNIIGTIKDSMKTEIDCPYCHSNDTKKISTTSRIISTSLFGLGSKKIGKQFHCNHCGADF